VRRNRLVTAEISLHCRAAHDRLGSDRECQLFDDPDGCTSGGQNQDQLS
jgi:hypothetical protein